MAGRLDGRVALITGASRGIGRALALAFAAEGAHVIALARTTGALEELDDAIKAKGGSATLVPLDLKDYAGIDRLGAAVHERWQRLDILVANAGLLGTLTPLAHLKPDTWTSLLDINVTANFRLIRSFDPLLRASPAGRAIFVSSHAAAVNRPYWGGYAITKAALEKMVLIYAEEVKSSALKVNLVDPGPTRTAMRAQAMPGEDPATLKTPEALTGLFLDLASPDCTRHGELVVYEAS
jgi:NAD(P)-dependent dehydrogenase (short-subunit alcohol dehydrogenase family)